MRKMQAYAALLDRLSFTASRNAKLVLVRDYLARAPDPERGWALASLTGELVFASAKPAMIRRAVEARVDAQLFAWSYDYVGDLAETVALIWPAPAGVNRPAPALEEVVDALRIAHRGSVQGLLEEWLDASDAEERWALLKLVTGGLRVGLSGRLAKQALSDLALSNAQEIPVSEIEEVWHALEPPYAELFAWLEGRGARPDPSAPGRFRPVMLAHPLEAGSDLERLAPEAYAAEWKWDGIRVQAARERDPSGALACRLYSRSGDDISEAFPDLLGALEFEGAIDGELLVMRPDGAAPFGDLQQRLNRKTVDAKTMHAFPVAIRAYDLLADRGEDLRGLPFRERRSRLEHFLGKAGGPLDLSPLQPFADWEELADLRRNPPPGEPRKAEGLMLKRWDSLYEAGRPRGPWFKWKRDPFLIDAVLMYAQRGHGKRSSYYSDYTFGVWSEGALTPVGKAYFGFTDEELKEIDKFVRDNTTERFGPVRAVRADRGAGLVFEVAFEGLQRSTRHRSGVAMRFPRISRIRRDKPPGEADTLDTLLRLLAALEAGEHRLS